MLLHIDLNIQDDKADEGAEKEAKKAAEEEQKKVSPSCYCYIILGTCCSNKLKMLLHIDLTIYRMMKLRRQLRRQLQKNKRR